MSRRQRGGATILVVACLGLLLFVGCALGVVAAMVAAHRRAQAAADLAAVGAAAMSLAGGDPCREAATLAEANGATLLTCSFSGTATEVTVRVAGPHWLGQVPGLVATSRAGPATD